MGWGTGHQNVAFPKPGRTLSVFGLLAKAGYQMVFSRMQFLTPRLVGDPQCKVLAVVGWCEWLFEAGELL